MKTENILIILALFVVIFLLFSNFSAATPTAPIVFQTPIIFYLLILVEDHALVLSLLDVGVKEDLEEEVGFQCQFLVVDGRGGRWQRWSW